MTQPLLPIYLTIFLAYALPILIAIAFPTLVEQKVLSYIQARKGPKIVGPFGLLQPVADGVKLFTKEPIQPSTSSPLLFTLTPVLALLLAISI
uniref:NADH-ubiquinone oxidoreductase chain 1 n=1 Tax=Falco tinnunculus TaxID=100819 RepID=A0A8C4ULR0_FALTI